MVCKPAVDAALHDKVRRRDDDAAMPMGAAARRPRSGRFSAEGVSTLLEVGVEGFGVSLPNVR
jgi:hypothetical protein